MEQILTEAVVVANEKKELMCKTLEEKNLVRIGDEMLQKYLSMYASDNSITLSKKQIEALDTLFELGYKHSFYDAPISTKDYLLPLEYSELRYS